MSVDISVCIANYNGVGVAERSIASALDQVVDGTFEVIVYDDGSSDGSVEAIRELFPTAKLITETQNVGYAIANNRMAAAASGRFLLFLNNDAFLAPGALQSLLDATAGEMDGILGLRQVQADTGQVIDHGMGLDWMFVPFPLVTADTKRLVSTIGACLWISKCLFHELGGFPDWFHSIAEDLYLCLQARLRGAEVRILENVEYLHHGGYSFGGGNPLRKRETSYRRRFLSERNRFWTMLIVLPWFLLPLSIVAWLTLWIFEATLLCLIARSFQPVTAIYIPAVLDTFTNASKIGTTRRNSQRSRCVSWSWFLAPMRLKPTKLVFLLNHGAPRLT